MRVAYQSESYANVTGYRTGVADGETYARELQTGVTFTDPGSTPSTCRDAFADFMNNDSAASDMVEGSGFNRVFNLFGEGVTRNTDPEDKAASGATRPCRPERSLSSVPSVQR